MPDLNPLLFAYGTLMSTNSGAKGRPQRERLARECRVIGPARTEGLLYHLGSYPGLVLPAPGAERVQGELIELTTPGATLAWLDAYEGIVPSRAANDYERLERPVIRDGVPPILAWVYVYRAPLMGARLLADGRWLAR